MDTFSHVPPGFRFHPTDEELVDYYLRKKIASKRIDLDVIKDVDLYKIEPWDLQELCRIGTEEQSDWYFFSHKDKKYPTGTRTNRATKAGFWKATGRDKAIYSGNSLIGMRKTLVFYKGRAPNGQKSDWIMHEYRLETNENGSPGQEEGYVVCRVFKKRMPTIMRRVIGDYGSPICSSSTTNWYDDQASMFMSSELDSPHQITLSSNQPNNYSSSSNNNNSPYHLHQFSSSKQQILGFHHQNDPFLQLPQLESPKVNPNTNCNSLVPYGINTQEDQIQQCHQQQNLNSSPLLQTNNIGCDQMTDWRVLDKLVAYHLSHDDQDGSKEINNSSNFSTQALFAMADHEQRDVLAVENEQKIRSDTAPQYASTSATSTCQIDLWK